MNGAGATFPAPFYNAWFQSFAKETGNKVNYQAVGSGSGVRQFTAKTVDFGASDGAVSDAKQKLPMIHVPMTGGAIVPAYNNPGCEAKMTQTQLADVFLGKITNWSEFGCADKNSDRSSFRWFWYYQRIHQLLSAFSLNGRRL